MSISSKSREAGTPAAAEAPYDVKPVLNGSSEQIAQFEAWLSGASCDDVSRLLLEPAFDRVHGHGPLAVLLTRRFRAFPVEERLAGLRRHVKGDDPRAQLGRVILDLAQDALPAHSREIATLFKQHNSGLSGSQVAEALRNWAAVDFDAALAFAQAVDLGEHRPDVPGRLLGQLAEQDLADAQRRVLLLSERRVRTAALKGVAETMAKTDLKGALEWLRQSGVSDHFAGVSGPLEEAMAAAARQSPVGVAEVILNHPGLFEGSSGPHRVGWFFGLWAQGDAAAAAAWLEAYPLAEKHHDRAYAAVVEAQMNGMLLDQAIETWQALPDHLRDTAREKLIGRLVAEDPARALDRLAGLVPADQRLEAMGEAFSKIPPSHQAQGLRWLPDLADYLTRRPDAAHGLTRLPADELDRALQGVPEEKRLPLQAALASTLAVSDPAKALALVSQVDPQAANPILYSKIATGMMSADPHQAAQWVAGFEEGSSKEWTAQNLVAHWARFDPGAATAWVEALPAGPSRNRATVELAYLHGLTGDHATAIPLAAAVRDDDRRLESYGFALQRLWRRDRPAAERALAQSGLAPDRRADLVRRLSAGEFTR